MKLTSNQIIKLAQLAEKAAKEAGQWIATTTAANRVAQSKEGGDSLASQVVTETDLRAQEIILELLEPSFLEYDLGLLTEELDDDGSRFEKDYFWCIDPLDGTLPFIDQVPGYSVSIALVAKEGFSVVGVVFDPRTLVCYSAIKGSGARKNGAPLRISESNNRALTLISDRSFRSKPTYTHCIESLAKEWTLSQEISNGGAAMNACWVVEHAPACYFKLPKTQNGGGSIWDFAATSLIVTEAGGFAGDAVSGSSLFLNDAQTTFMNRLGVVFASSEEVFHQVLGLPFVSRGR